MRVRTSHVLFSVCLIASAACGRAADEQPPVAAPSVSLSSDRAAIGSPLRMTYRFEPTDRKIAGDFLVFVHVLDEDGERMWGDDHRPPVPTSSWQAGKPVEYSRTVFVPNYPYIGPAQIRIGLYQPSTGERLPLAAKEASMREYVVASVQIQPQSDNIFLIYKDGWHPTETQPQDPTVEWQWTHKTATVSFSEPARDRRRDRARARCRSHVPARHRGHPRARDPGVPRVHRAETRDCSVAIHPISIAPAQL
jgi:hypothetical protein